MDDNSFAVLSFYSNDEWALRLA